MSTSLPSDAGADCAAGASSDLAGAESSLAGAASASPSNAITCSPSTVAPSSCEISVITPSFGATTSKTTLSVSISTKFWSRLTLSPTLTCHVQQ